MFARIEGDSILIASQLFSHHWQHYRKNTYIIDILF